eukprot:364487-Chlamydomonas_euryale.AAC.30
MKELAEENKHDCQSIISAVQEHLYERSASCHARYCLCPHQPTPDAEPARPPPGNALSGRLHHQGRHRTLRCRVFCGNSGGGSLRVLGRSMCASSLLDTQVAVHRTHVLPLSHSTSSSSRHADPRPSPSPHARRCFASLGTAPIPRSG